MTAITAVALRIRGIPSEEASRLRRLEPDANGQTPVEMISDGKYNPCRHCLGLIAEGGRMLLLGYRPFDELQPYAETGPIFLHLDDCAHYNGEQMPAWFDHFEPAIIRGYSKKNHIRYDTGKAVAGGSLLAACREILGDESVAYVHIRSKFNCFQCRVDRE